MDNIENNTPVTKNFVLIGPQGSGKGTQAQILIEKYNFQYISTGNLLRQISSVATPLGVKIKNIIDKGELLPDELLMEVFHNELQSFDKTKGILIDGTPRTLTQAEMLDKIFADENLTLPKAINININRPAAIDRLTKRRTCKDCQTTYLPSDSSSLSGKCEKCGGEVITRADDNAEAITRRLDLYYQETEPILNYYYQSYRLVKINGEQSIDAVAKDVAQVIESTQI